MGIVVAEVIMAPQLLTDTITISPTIILGMLVDINCPTKGTRLNIFIHYRKGIYKITARSLSEIKGHPTTPYLSKALLQVPILPTILPTNPPITRAIKG